MIAAASSRHSWSLRGWRSWQVRTTAPTVRVLRLFEPLKPKPVAAIRLMFRAFPSDMPPLEQAHFTEISRRRHSSSSTRATLMRHGILAPMSADLTHKSLCGCKVRFSFDSGFRTSKMFPCAQHSKGGQIAVWAKIQQAARQWCDSQIGIARMGTHS